MSANTGKCADNDKTVCDYNEFRRLRYFHGMLLDDKDFQAEQQYHAGKRRLLNRMLHGSGVVCGLDIKGKKDGQWIEISSGLALDCSGNEIWVPKTQHVDLNSLLPPKDKPKNAECKEVEDQGDVKTYYIGIRYEEKPTNPVSVYLPSGSCEEKTCENSRYKEGFCIEVVDCCPEKYPPGLLKTLCDCENGVLPDSSTQLCRDCGQPPKDFTGYNAQGQGQGSGQGQNVDSVAWCKCVRLEEFCETSVECPDCCSCDKCCYVVLGQIQVKDCKLQSVCINECRKYVLTGQLLRHMLLGVFAGSEDYFYADVNGVQTPLPDVGELVANPIKALCFFLQNLVVENGSFEYRGCQAPVAQQPQPAQTAEQIQAQMAILTKRQADLQRDITKFRDVNLARIEELNKANIETTTDKSTTKPGKK